MKTKFTLLIFLAVAFYCGKAQQVPNNRFNTWTSDLNPDGWVTLDELIGQQLGLATEDNTDTVNGPSLKLATTDEPTQNGEVAFAGLVSLGTGSLNLTTGAASFDGIYFPYRPDTITVVSKYTSTSTDSGVFYLDLTNDTGGVILALEQALPYGPSNTSWVSTSYLLTDRYDRPYPSDTLVLQFVSSPSTTPPLGSVLHVNGVYFGYVSLPTGLQNELNSLNLSVYPNPASETLNISSIQDITGYTVLIYDMNGKLVCTKHLTDMKSSINVTSYSSGTYIYKIADRTGNILQEDKFIVTR